jgi:hypothetical protein
MSVGENVAMDLVTRAERAEALLLSTVEWIERLAQREEQWRSRDVSNHELRCCIYDSEAIAKEINKLLGRTTQQ